MKAVSWFPTRLRYTTFGGMPTPNYAVAPDGRRFLMNVVAQQSSTSPITVVLNWPAGMKR
jgi:hypothetical protein